MKLTDEELERFRDITTDNITTDIKDTEKEIEDFRDEFKVLNRNPVSNKERLYMIQGHISSREEFVEKLNQILEYRKRKNK